MNATAIESTLRAAQAAEDRANEALGEAQLAAMTGGAPVPGALVGGAQAAKERRVSIESALAALERGRVQGEQDAAQLKRAELIGRVEAATNELEQMGLQLIAAVDQLMTSGAGAKAAAAARKVSVSLGAAHTDVLTPNGWVTSDGIRTVRNLPPEAIVADLVKRVAEGHGAARAGQALKTMCAEIVAGTRAQPGNWQG